MNLNKLYKLQAELDEYIQINAQKRTGQIWTGPELLDNTILALLVEVGELANTTRCFKHWSTKGMMEKEVVLDELADVIHFYLSIGNQIGYRQHLFSKVEPRLSREEDLDWMFRRLYYWIAKFDTFNEYSYSNDIDSYVKIGEWINKISTTLNFTNLEVEQAYLKKHEENYKRQREGY